MFAIRQYAFGPPENLHYEEVPDPEPSAGQVRIAVKAAGVHLIDTSIRAGEAAGAYGRPALPMTPGREVAGAVDAIGPEVDKGWLGKRVVTHLGPASGGYAELAVRETTALHVLPDNLDFDAAVAMIGTGRTAMAILDVAALRSDDVVLITAAAGGLGALVVQAARRAGAFAVGVAGGEAKVELVRRLGADVAVDYNRDDWPQVVRESLGGRPVTVALDGVGGRQGRAALELLAPGGRIVLFGWASGEHTQISTQDLFERGITATAAIGARLMSRPGGFRDFEERALQAAASRELAPLIEHRYALKDAAQAHAALESRATVGKVVLLP